MTILNPEHLLDQAEALLGRPRQANLRRAISTAYYAVFHTILAAAADRVVGRARRGTAHYALVYRGIDHRGLLGLCATISRPALPPKYRGLAPTGGFGEDMRAFAQSLADLQYERHLADYDPAWRLHRSVECRRQRPARGLFDAIAVLAAMRGLPRRMNPPLDRMSIDPNIRGGKPSIDARARGSRRSSIFRRIA